MEASKEGEMPSEPAPETLPTEIKEEGPKKTKLLAVIIVVIVVIAAIAAAFGLGLIGGKKEKTNLAPSCGARAMTDTTIDIGGSVTFESTASDSDGSIAMYNWYWGDGTNSSSATLNKTSHTYQYGGVYLVYHAVTDDKGKNASNEASMIRITVTLYQPPEDLEAATNTTAPFAFLVSDKEIIQNNTAVAFNMTSSYGVGGWAWYNVSNHSEGASWDSGVSYLTNLTLEFGDGATGYVTPTTYMAVSHTYVVSGHYASKLTVKANNTNNAVQTIVMRTIHVLTPATTPGGAVKNPGTFIYATIGEPQYLDPAFDYETAGGEVLQNVYENLIWYDGSSAATFKPVLATAVPTVANGLITDGGLNYTFNLRTGVTFHDGTVMNADDVVYSIQRVLQIHDPAGAGWMLEQVLSDYVGFKVGKKNISAFTDASDYNVSWILNALNPTVQGWDHVINENDVKNVSEAVVLRVNDTAVKFRLTHPYPGFIPVMAYTIGNIVSKDFVEAHGGIVGGTHNTYMEQHTCGTGPYQLVTWEVGSKIHMTKFDNYWGVKPTIKDVYIVKATDVNTRILMLQAGDADSIDLQIKYESLFAGKADYVISKGGASFDLTFMVFNFNVNSTEANAQFGGNISDDFFHDIHMRKAFSHLINYSLYISNVAMGNGAQPNGVIPKGMFGYNASTPKQEYNLTAAAAEFQLATNINTANGLTWWESGFTIPMFYNAGNLARQTASEMVKTGLEAVGGGHKTATVNALDWPSYLDQMFDDNSYMPFYTIGWGPDYADPDDYTVPMLDSDYGTYPIFSGYVNDTINTLLRSAASDVNPTTRAATYSEMSMKVFEDCPYVWLNQPNEFEIHRAWIGGYIYNPMFSNLYYPSLTKG